MPELLTMAEAGVPGVAQTDYAMFAPAGTPREVIALNREVNARANEDFRARMAALGIEAGRHARFAAGGIRGRARKVGQGHPRCQAEVRISGAAGARGRRGRTASARLRGARSCTSPSPGAAHEALAAAKELVHRLHDECEERQHLAVESFRLVRSRRIAAESAPHLHERVARLGPGDHAARAGAVVVGQLEPGAAVQHGERAAGLFDRAAHEHRRALHLERHGNLDGLRASATIASTASPMPMYSGASDAC